MTLPDVFLTTALSTHVRRTSGSNTLSTHPTSIERFCACLQVEELKVDRNAASDTF